MLISDIGVDPVWNAIKKIPTVITIDFGVWLFFSKWAWKWKMFQGWLVPFPVLAGTWSGVMKSTWIDPVTGKTPSPISFTLVIKQSFLSVSCAIYTKESISTSYSAEILVDKETKRKQLVYHYTNRPQASARDRSEIHDGTALLDIIGDKPLEIRGEYWTSRKTTGDIEAKFISRELRESFLES
jgi:hypothetical protein